MLDCGRNKNMSFKAAIYDPYLDTLGGGERYCLSVGEILQKQGYKVDVFWSGNQDLLTRAENRFNLDLKGISFVPDIFGLVPQKIDLIEEDDLRAIHSQPHPILNPIQKIKKNIQKFKILSQYDFIFYLSDGSIPFFFAKKNFLHVQVPFVNKDNLIEKLSNFIKSKSIAQVICNSNFTSKFVDDFSKNKVQILYPPVDVEKFSPSSKKEDNILSVGRFDNILNAKKQDVLIEAFKKLMKNNPNSSWKLILMGGSREEPEKNHYLSHLKYLAKDLPVEFIINPDFEKLKDVYSRSKIYWHAAGYGVDELVHPEQTEHFGMTVVEAMASGLVPLVVTKGGLTEIVSDGKNGYTWQTLDQLVAKTQLLFATPQDILTLSKNAQESSKLFSKQIFEEKLISLINK